MSRYMVAVGGTGQHVMLVSADLHVLLHGATTEPPDVPVMLLLDADATASGREERTAYQHARDQVGVLSQVMKGQSGNIRLPVALPPLPSRVGEEHVTADQVVDHQYGRGASLLMLSRHQRSRPVHQGYFGEPRLGAALAEVMVDEMTATRDESERQTMDVQRREALEVWRQLSQDLQRDDSRVVLTGSAVGGTGAGVLPLLLERLLEREGRRARLGAVVGLPWFRIAGGVGTARQRENGSSCLWRYRRFLADRAQNLTLCWWGHWSVNSAPEEQDQGDVQQAVKSSLGMPWYAAAAAHRILFQDERPGHLTPMASNDPGRVITPQLHAADSVPQLGELIHRNHQVVAFLRLLDRYLDRPYRVPVMRMARHYTGVPAVDGLPPASRRQLKDHVSSLIEAKVAALKRLGDSDPTLDTKPTLDAEGLDQLREFLGDPEHEDTKGGQTEVQDKSKRAVSDQGLNLGLVAARMFPTLPKPERVDSTRAVLPTEVFSEMAGQEASPEGLLGALQTHHIQRIAGLHLVHGSRIPDRDGLALLIKAVLGDPNIWRESLDPEAIVGRDGRLIPPDPLRTDGETTDAAHHWMKRWTWLAVALLAGRCEINTLQMKVRGQTRSVPVVTLRRITGNEPTGPIGTLHRELLCVPTLDPAWEADDVGSWLLRDTDAGHFDDLRIARAWLRTVRRVGECKDKNVAVPPWIEWLERVLSVALRGDFMRSGLVRPSNSNKAIIAWGDRRTDVEVPLHTCDASTVQDRPFVETVAGPEDSDKAFALEIEEISAAPRDSGGERLRDQIPTFHLPAVDGTTAPLTLTWADRVPQEVVDHEVDGLLLLPGDGKAWRMPRLLSVEEVWNPIAFWTGAEAPFLPISRKYAPLLDGDFTVTRSPETREVRAEASLKGRSEPAVHTWPAGQVVNREGDGFLSLLYWPAVHGRSAQTHHLLVRFFNPDLNLQARLIYTATNGTVGAGPPWSSAGSFHTVDGSDAVGEARWVEVSLPSARKLHIIDEGVTDRLAGEGEVSLGVARLPKHVVPWVAGHESWCVDFGTSSSVIVRMAGGHRYLIAPRRTADATAAIVAGETVRRDSLHWFPTWDEYSSIGDEHAQELLPSVILRNKDDTVVPVRYGQDHVLDHGGPLADALDWSEAVGDLKWEPTAAPWRKAFIRRLVEQAVAMSTASAANSSAPTVAQNVTLVFSLPVAQVGQRATLFCNEVGAVCQKLTEDLGIRFTPTFSWESVLVSPMANPTSGRCLDVVADLGGGSLDLFARLWNGSVEQASAIESCRSGGSFCVRAFAMATGKDERALSRQIRQGLKDGEQAVMRNHPLVQDFFDLQVRVLHRWVEGLRTLWKLDDKVPCRVRMAGLGWSLPGGPRREDDLVRHLRLVVNPPGYTVEASPAEIPPTADVPRHGRKVLLAWNGASPDREESRHDAGRLQGSLAELVRIVGVSGRQAADSKTPDSLLADVGPGYAPDLADLQALWPLFTPSHAETIHARLRTPWSPQAPTGAVEDQFNLLRTPLSVAAEVAIEDLLDRARRG